MKIAFMISTLQQGGAERVAVTLMNQWANLGHEVCFFTNQDNTKISDYLLHETVQTQSLNSLQSNSGKLDFVWQNIKRVVKIRRTLKSYNPDVVISFITEMNILTLLASMGTKWSTVVSERIHPGYHHVRRIDALARKIVYPWADSIVVQTRDIQKWIKENLKLNSTVLPNPTNIKNFSRPKNMLPEGESLIVSVGRLDHQKGFDILIAAFAEISNQFPNWQLKIYGEGPLRSELEKQISRANLENTIALSGVSNEIQKHLWESSIYVHPARYEGFPNAIIEALAAGCCVIASDGPTAASELLCDGKYGVLVENGSVLSLSKTMAQLMENKEERALYTEQTSTAVSHMDIRHVADQWVGHIEAIR